MRDFRDAKAMAHALRDALKAKAVETTHSESLELIANAFGYANWNILAAKIEAAAPRAPAQEPAGPKTLYCSFCGKSQHDVRKLIAGPSVYICDECVELCVGIINDQYNYDKILRLLQPDEESGDPAYPAAFREMRGVSSEELTAFVERGRSGVARNRLALQGIERKLAMREGEVPADDDILGLIELGYLRDKPRDELLALQQTAQAELKRYEDGLRIATMVLAERGQEGRYNR
jgi:hypothetical protein